MATAAAQPAAPEVTQDEHDPGAEPPPPSDHRFRLDMAAYALTAPPLRTVGYWAPSPQARRRRRHGVAGVPIPHLSWRAALHVALDELVLGGFMLLRRPPSEASWYRIRHEIDHALALADERGWSHDPRSYHVDPPPLADHEIRVRQARSGRLRYETLTWLSGWAPHPGEPGRERWLRYRPNHVAAAHVIRHADAARRPWVVCVHGTSMGRADLDLRVFRASHLAHGLGCNVALPVLPLHGRRKAKGIPDAEFPTIDIVDNVHGLAQSAWDVRRLLSWVRAQDPTGVALVGLSLGGGVAALTGSLEPVDALIPCVPAVDFPTIFQRATPRPLREEEHYQVLGAPAAALHRVVSPLRMPTATEPEARFLFAGLTDRLLDPVDQAAALWEHWGRPEVRWFEGGHVGHMLSPEIGRFVDDALERRGLVVRSAGD
jgi:hypothetical protein